MEADFLFYREGLSIPSFLRSLVFEKIIWTVSLGTA